MKHLFDVEIAAKYGVNAAILLENLYYWIAKNEANEVNYYDGNYWTYNSRKAFQEMFPYMSKRQIDGALEKLIDEGLVVTGNYNKMAYDRTLWYALTEKGKCISRNETMENTKCDNGLSQNVSPIPDNKPNINTDNNIYSDDSGVMFKTSETIPPTLRDVQDYCRERNNGIDAERFIDYYEARDWKIKGVKMKSWKAAVRTWERYDKSGKPEKETASYDLGSWTGLEISRGKK